MNESLNPQFVELLACPLCHVEVSLAGEELTCKQCKRRYPIVNGIVILLPEYARDPASIPVPPPVDTGIVP